jgi:hypothetical protein
MIRLRLLRRFCLMVLGYDLQATVLMTMTGLGFKNFFGRGGPATLPWDFLNTFALIGIVAGLALFQFFHREEDYLYANHGLTRGFRFAVASIVIWLAAGTASIGLQIGDGRIQPLWLLGQGQALLPITP